MAKVLVLTWESGGGLPTLGVARRLCERGHDVRVLSNPTLDTRYGQHIFDGYGGADAAVDALESILVSVGRGAP